MCFSAEASFGAGAVLSATGIITMKKVQEPAQLAFAAIPLFFGIQQLAEGFVWITLSHDQYMQLQQMAVYIYTFFSHMLWPVWVPFAVLLFEKEQKKKNILFGIFSVAMLLSLGELYYIINFGVIGRVIGHHIQYSVNFPQGFILVSDVLYPSVTFIPCFISSQKRLRLFSATLIISALITEVIYQQWRVSAWCFFAAILSVIVYFILKELPENKKIPLGG